MTESFKKIDNWEILTKDGFKPFLGVSKTNKKEYLSFSFKKGDVVKNISCSYNHSFLGDGGVFVYAETLEVGDFIFNGYEVIKKEVVKENVALYDAKGVEGGHYITDEDIVSHNCAFINNIEDTFTAAQQTLATGGSCTILSSPNGASGFFYDMFMAAESGDNTYVPIKLPWQVHPERDQEWRDQQTRDLGEKKAAQECDAEFVITSGTVLEPEDIKYFEDMTQEEPKSFRGNDGNFWVWEECDFTKDYMVIADVARGDSTDYSTFQVLEIDTLNQVAEFRSKIPPKDFGNVLVGVATEYNNAVLIIENTAVGWATIEQVMHRGYTNVYHSSNDVMETVESYMSKEDRDRLTPGFTMSAKSRPLVVNKLQEHIRDRDVIIRSRRLIAEFRSFIWKNGKPQAQWGSNDDLLMAYSIGLYVRDTALRIRGEGHDLIKAQLNAIHTSNANGPVISQTNLGSFKENPYIMKTPYGDELFTWVLK